MCVLSAELEKVTQDELKKMADVNDMVHTFSCSIVDKCTGYYDLS